MRQFFNLGDSPFRDVGLWEAQLNGPYRQRLVAGRATITVTYPKGPLPEILRQALPTILPTMEWAIPDHGTLIAAGKNWRQGNLNSDPLTREAFI
jgi:hypothetical protein